MDRRNFSKKLALVSLLPSAEQKVFVTQLALTSDKVSFLAHTDSNRILLGFQLEHERALADRAQRIAEIEMLAGGDIDRKKARSETNKPLLKKE